MTNLTIDTAQFPKAVPTTAKVGDRVHVTVAGIVRRIEGDFIDISRLGGLPESLIGATEVEVMIQEITPA